MHSIVVHCGAVYPPWIRLVRTILWSRSACSLSLLPWGKMVGSGGISALMQESIFSMVSSRLLGASMPRKCMWGRPRFWTDTGIEHNPTPYLILNNRDVTDDLAEDTALDDVVKQ